MALALDLVSVGGDLNFLYCAYVFILKYIPYSFPFI